MSAESSKGIAIRQIYDVNDEEQEQDLWDAVELCVSRMPEEECYDEDELFRLIKDHLSGKFGSHRPSIYWKGYCFVAKRKIDVVGMLLCYMDLQFNFSFFSFIAVAKPKRSEDKRLPDKIGRDLLTKFFDSYQQVSSRPIRFLSEFDHPLLANNKNECEERKGRIRWFNMVAEYIKIHLQMPNLDLRVLDLDYVQPQLDSSKPENQMLLLYIAPNLPLSLPKSEVSQILTWIYTNLYSEDIIKEPCQGVKYGVYLRQLLEKTIAVLPNYVPLLLPEQIYKPGEFGCYLKSEKPGERNQRLQSATQKSEEVLIDFAIVTAIKIERLAILKAFNIDEVRDREHKETHTYWRKRFSLEDDKFYEIVVAQSLDMANVNAAILTNDMLHHWKPAAVLMVGIAAAAKPEPKQHLGDLVIGREVYYYETSKVTADGKLSEPKYIPVDSTLLDRVQALPSSDFPILSTRPDGTDTRPEIEIGVIASGDKVIADATERDTIATANRKIMAIEMEGYGVISAAQHSFNQVRCLVIRSLCDYADSNKHDQWHTYAASVAAGFTKAFLLDEPLQPRNSSGGNYG